jgi:hypothetical protein
VSGKVKHRVDEHVVKAVERARNFLLAYGEDGGLADDSELHDRWWRSQDLKNLLGPVARGWGFDPPGSLEWNEALCQGLVTRANQGDGEAVGVLRTAAAMLLHMGTTMPASLRLDRQLSHQRASRHVVAAWSAPPRQGPT